MNGGASASQHDQRARSTGDLTRVVGARGILGRWNDAGVLAPADVHITERLVRMCGERLSDPALLGTALAIRAVRLGSTCLALDRLDDIPDDPSLALPPREELITELLDSPLVVGTDAGPLRPLVLMTSDDGPLLYLQKYFRQEQAIRDILHTRSQSAPEVDQTQLRTAVGEVFGKPDSSDHEAGDLQRHAAVVAATRWTTILAGGPGTGKTYTVARILAVLRMVHGGGLRVGLCAPTGRAAAQLQASASLRDDGLPSGAPPQAVTVHSLLGWYPGSNPRFGRGHSLPHDVIVVDETSMLSMTAMSRVLEAARPDARVIFVGDPHQLASVDAGAVLADLVERTGAADGPDNEVGDGVITLRREYRFAGGIAELAAAVNAGDASRVLDLLTDPGLADIELVAPDALEATRHDVISWGDELRTAALAADADAAVDALDSHRVLCAHREGFWGVRGWSRRIAEWLGHADGDGVGWYAGQPILVTANDRQTRTFNGDTGVVIVDPGTPGPLASLPAPGTFGPLASLPAPGTFGPLASLPAPDRSDALRVAFRRGSEIRMLHPTALAEATTVHAMTIHRSQGSQFERVTVVLPPTGSELLTRELLYTAITRAQKAVRIIATPDVVRAAVDRRVQRASGLRSPVTPLTR